MKICQLCRTEACAPAGRPAELLVQLAALCARARTQKKTLEILSIVLCKSVHPVGGGRSGLRGGGPPPEGEA